MCQKLGNGPEFGKCPGRGGGCFWAQLGLTDALHALEDQELLFQIFYTVCKKVPRKITDKYMENLSKPLEKFKDRYAPQIF